MTTFAKASFGAASYAAFRPTYPESLYNAVVAYHRGPKKLCLDLGCGTGIATRGMGSRFENAVGTDPSAGMVKQAGQNTPKDQYPNIEFRQGAGESTPSLSDGSVDCATAAQSSHWFDYTKFWPEMRRLVRPGGTVACWGYKDHVFVDSPIASKILLDYLYNKDPDKLGSYWEPGRQYVKDKLRIIQPPPEDWEDVQRIEYEPGTNGHNSGEGTLFMEKRLTVGECKDYVRTFSSYVDWKENHPGQEPRATGGKGDLADQMFDEIAESDQHFRSDENLIDIEWGSALVRCRKK